jgi:hypothetical protein
MNEKEMNLAILNKLYEIADKVFNEGVNVKEGNYTASDLAKMRDSAFKDGVKLEKLFKDAQKKSLVSSKEEIAAVPDDTLDSVPNEHLASEKCTEQAITPLTKENVSERKETVSAAKVVAISIGVPSCLDIPPNNMRLDIAANKPLNAAVGDCLCGVGKVVHTLPLPPPRSKEISELITYTNFYNTS